MGHYQLAFIVCLYIAVKAQETIVLDINLMVQLSRGLCDIEDIEEMELTILVALQWRINGPTSYDFVRYYVDTLVGRFSDSAGTNAGTSMVTEEVMDGIMKYSFRQADLASTEYDLILCPPSHIAICAISNAILEASLLSIHTKQDLLGMFEKQTSSSSYHVISDQSRVGNANTTMPKFKILLIKNMLHRKICGTDDSAVVSDDESDDDEIIVEEAKDTNMHSNVDDESYKRTCRRSPSRAAKRRKLHDN